MENNSKEMTKEEEMNILNELSQKNNNKQNKFPMIVPAITKIIKNKKNNNLTNTKMNKNQLLIDYNRTSVNINNFKKNLPKIITSYTPIEKRNTKYSNITKNKNKKTNNIYNLSRNFDISPLNNSNSETSNYFRRKKNKNNFIENDNYNDINLNQNITQFSKNLDNYESNFDNSDINFLTHNNININTLNKNSKIKFDMNKKNVINKIKHPSKINFNINKKNLKYKIPINMINNLNQKRKKISNENNESRSNSRKLNLKQKNNSRYNNINNITKNSPKKDLNIESTFITFNNLVSQAKELGHLLIDNKDLLKSENFDFLENEENNDLLEINNIKMNSEISKLNQEIKNEHKNVEQLEKINSELNNKIILFNDNAKEYEKKVEELIAVINQVKNINSNNSNNSDNISNGISNNRNDCNLRKNNSSNFTLEKKPKKKKYKFGFVELIFMKDDKFQVIQKKKPPKYEISENKNFLLKKQNKEPKLVFVNMNKKLNNNKLIKTKANNEEFLDAASQMANHIIIESLLSLKEEKRIK